MRVALLFDVDGTLADTMGAGKAALSSAMTAVYGETGPVDSYDFHGRTDPEIVRGLLSAAGWADSDIDDGFADLWPLYVERLAGELAARRREVTSLPGVAGLLDLLAGDERFACGLVTGNVEPGAHLKLGAAGFGGRFEFGAFGSDAERRDALPAVALARAARRHGHEFEPARAVVIGDTPADIQCARAAGTRVLAVATGRHDAGVLAACEPDAVVADLSDAEGIVAFFAAELEAADG